MNLSPRQAATERGFTLIEMSIVLVIVLVLMGGLLAGLSAQVDNASQAKTDQTLSDIREALLGFAAVQRRLPCPAAPAAAGAGAGTELPLGGGVCTNGLNGAEGFVPGTTLGVGPTDPQGYVLDGWNRRIRYTVTASPGAHANAFTTADGMKNAGMGNLAPNLSVCNSATGIGGGICTVATRLTDNAVAVVYSVGKNWGTVGNDQAANQNGDQVFVSHDPVAMGDNTEFDDQMIWISPYTLYSRMISAGALP
jgi:prepilin-type N-terminal cleavage/methylation domain-containing protein